MTSGTVRLIVAHARPRGMGSFEALRLPCLEASHTPLGMRAAQFHSAEDVAKFTMACACTSSESTKGAVIPEEITDNSLQPMSNTSA